MGEGQQGQQRHLPRQLPNPSIHHPQETMKSTFALLALAAFASSAFAVAPPETLPSGVKIVHTVDGTGAQPKASDTVKVHYRGTLADGKEFDSSFATGTPAKFKVDQVLPGWQEILPLMRVGDTWQVFLPSEKAYGERGPRSIGPNQALQFEIKLIEVK